VMQDNVRRQKPHWRSKEQVQVRYEEVCAQLHLPDDLYTVELSQNQGRLHMNFRKNHYRINRYIDRFGKNILITDNMDWSTDDIVRASLDRYIVEEAFRQSKDDDLVSLMPLRHWTDSKIRCHILTCIVALAYLRILQIRLEEAGVAITANKAMDSMRTLHSCLVWQPKKRNPQRLIEEPDKLQTQILKAFGLKIKGGVLQVA
jgi:transposase